MKKYFFLLVVSTNLFAEGFEECKLKQKSKSIQLLSQIDHQVKLQELESISTKSSDKTISYLTEPSKRTCSTVTYKFPEIEMKANESVYFHVPKDLRERGVRFMVLGHRQKPNDNTAEGQWDDTPGLSSVQVFNGKNWNYWNGPSSGDKGAKFAETRSSAEIENLYDWDKYGYVRMETKETSTSELLPEAMKVTSVGTDLVYLSELTLKVNPPKESSNQEYIYSKGTKFTPNDPNQKYILSGGQKFEGKFPGAKKIHSYDSITIPVKAGMKITSIDIACGDSHPDGKKNSDGGYGTQGWAKLSVGLKNSKGEIKWFMSRENVPPEGMLIASPAECDEITEPGSEIVISSEEDTTYVMGVHVGYGN